MKVALVAQTVFWPDEAARAAGYVEHDKWVHDSDELAEFGGRLCYKSWNRPNPATATNEGYIANIVQQGHFSVLEHGSASFYIEGISRSLTHELVRHRHFSYSQVSQRYVDESHFELIIPPDLKEFLNEKFYEDESDVLPPNPTIDETLNILRDDMSYLYQALVDFLVKKGLSRKAARGAARSVLPNGTETAILVTGNMRAWREFVAKRYSPHADTEIRNLAGELLRQLKENRSCMFSGYGTGDLVSSFWWVPNNGHVLDDCAWIVEASVRCFVCAQTSAMWSVRECVPATYDMHDYMIHLHGGNEDINAAVKSCALLKKTDTIPRYWQDASQEKVDV